MSILLTRLGLVALLTAPLRANDNVLLLIADDLGVDRIAAYAEHPDPGLTPHIDRLAAQGVLFRNCWSNPYCSATRATIWTGRYSFRTGVGWYVNPFQDEIGLKEGEWTLPHAVHEGSQGRYATAFFAKWHMAGLSQGQIHPNVVGWDHYRGQPDNVVNGMDYFDWEKVTDGAKEWVHVYATSEAVDDALEVIDVLGDTPWFLAVGFHAPHHPLHAPPRELHDYNLRGDPDDTPFLHTKAMVQAMDTEIGRLLGRIDPRVLARTTIVFVADNGTAPQGSVPPFVPDHGKPTLFEGGVNVPLIISGRGVSAPGTECAALVNTTDIFATVCEITGVPSSSPGLGMQPRSDSVSLVPYFSDPAQTSLRKYVYAERFMPNHQPPPYEKHARAIRDGKYKLIQDVKAGTEAFYNLQADPFERVDLLSSDLTLEQEAAYDGLVVALAELLASK